MDLSTPYEERHCSFFVGIQTDNGKGFTTWWDSPRSTLFEKVCDHYGASRRTIPFGASTYNSAVESSHRIIEDECY